MDEGGRGLQRPRRHRHNRDRNTRKKVICARSLKVFKCAYGSYTALAKAAAFCAAGFVRDVDPRSVRRQTLVYVVGRL